MPADPVADTKAGVGGEATVYCDGACAILREPTRDGAWAILREPTRDGAWAILRELTRDGAWAIPRELTRDRPRALRREHAERYDEEDEGESDSHGGAG